MIDLYDITNSHVTVAKDGLTALKTCEVHAGQIDKFVVGGMQGTIVLPPFDLVEYKALPPTPGTDRTAQQQTVYVEHNLVHYIGDRNIRKASEGLGSVLGLVGLLIPLFNGKWILGGDGVTKYGPFSFQGAEPFLMTNEIIVYQATFAMKGLVV